eukprot:TRINITY_DN15300_c0_g1_i1.p1 TRINITY_DN15300_c0_g1~~TRINITY_DN15300_c0_g1_i1.p1  ORF type:complete len:707 (+),score=213.18 TRINITY_DN15300_c0_g1_i1:85-2205(+)
MPKQRVLGRGDPYRNFLEDRQFGVRRFGVQDRLARKMADDMLNFTDSKGNSKYTSYFEHSEHPFYSVSRYMRGKEGRGVFTTDHIPVSSPGGIFNIEFNSDGKILAAACERKSILIFDPLTRKIARTIENAHSDCVNCIRFLDSRTFATCSDDTTVALWDARNLKNRVRTLRGHSNWVKNIEYDSRESLLVTSGFDGAIYTWDINQYQESQAEFKKVFYTNGLMRMRLTPDSSKMVISTMNGYLVVVHDLDLHTMSEDLAGFKPNMYRLMQISGKALELAINYTSLFHTKRNRVEIISDFPDGNDAEVLSSLRLHPQGWVALSRNTSSDESTEWCTVHDIQSLPTNPDDDELISSRTPLMWRSTNHSRLDRDRPAPPPAVPIESDPHVQTYRAGSIEIVSTGSRGEEPGPSPVIEIDLNLRRRERRMTGQEEREEREERDGEDDDEREIENDEPARDFETGEEDEVEGTRFLSANSLAALETIRELQQRRTRGAATNSVAAAGEALVAGEEAAAAAAEHSAEAAADARVGNGEARREGRRINIIGAGNVPFGAEEGFRSDRGGFLIIGPNTGPRGRGRVLYFGTPGAHRAQQQRIPKDARIHKNVNRLTHYIEESNTGKGFIKEQSFSPCGRFIASPFGYGVRLLGFSETGADLSQCVPSEPVRLYELGTKLGHNEVVLSSAFSPCHWLLATGCLSGRIVWHQPVL